jgi:site-specific DNA-methyltransferase (adenine-specific)
MVQLHGVSHPGHPSRSENLGITSAGFGVNKLSALLGESNAQTSKDLELAELIITIPQLAKAETKEAARRTALLATTVAIALKQSAANPPKQDQKWTLYEGGFEQNAFNMVDNSCDLVLVDPPYGEDTSGMGPNSKQLLAGSFNDSESYTTNLIGSLARETWRVLRPNNFAGFFFGFTVYGILLNSLQREGFQVDLAPLVWIKNTVINTSPYTRYGRSYEPILLARKGEPKLIRPTQRDVIQIDNVITRGVNEQKLYQAQKPVALIEKLILDLCVPGGTVVDFCAGSGTTGEAALKNGRRVVLFEKDATACQIIRGRLGKL